MGAVVPVVLLLALALVEAAVLPQRIWAKAVWMLAVLGCGWMAVSELYTLRQSADRTVQDRYEAEAAALRGLWSQWDGLSRALPAPKGEPPAAKFDTIDDALASLSAKVASVGEQVEALKAGMKNRVVDAETTVKLAEYLRQYGRYRAIVSCPPGDLEAYTYANQLANILRTAGWDAHGPEATTAGEGPDMGMGISLYVRNPAAPEAAKVLIDAFARFNIPYHSGIAENDAIPDQATVELYVSKKP